MKGAKMAYQTDAERLCASHISNDRPAPQDDERTAAAEEYAGRLIAESVPSREDRIQDAYWRLREQMQQGVPGGEDLWGIARVGYDIAAQDKKNGRIEQASVYGAMATLAAVKFEVARKMAVSA
mgnify:FL=1